MIVVFHLQISTFLAIYCVIASLVRMVCMNMMMMMMMVMVMMTMTMMMVALFLPDS